MADCILVIDDSPTVRKLLCSSLRACGYTTVEAENGMDGIEKLATVKADLVMVDLNMPNVDGLEFTRLLRANPDLCHIPVVMLSTEGSARDRARGAEAGVDAYLVKPIAPSMLEAKIRALLDARAL